MVLLMIDSTNAGMPIAACKSPPRRSLEWVSSIGIDLLNLNMVSGFGINPWKPVFIRSILVIFSCGEIASLYPYHFALFL